MGLTSFDLVRIGYDPKGRPERLPESMVSAQL